MIRAVVIVALGVGLAARGAEAKGCHEVSEVVGHQHCGWFGEWSRDAAMPPLWIEAGGFSHHYESEPFTLGPASAHGLASDRLATIAHGSHFRLLVGRLFYAGGEVEMGWLSRKPTVVGEPPPAWGSDLEGHLVGGVHVALWRVGLGTEVAMGGRWQDLASCDPKADPMCKQVTNDQTRRQFELRAHADLFLTPRFSIGVQLARSAIDHDDTQVFVSAGFHMLAMDGAP